MTQLNVAIANTRRNLTAARIAATIDAYARDRFLNGILISVGDDSVTIASGRSEYAIKVSANNPKSGEQPKSLCRTVDFDPTMLERLAGEDGIEDALKYPNDPPGHPGESSLKALLIYAIRQAGGAKLQVRTEVKYEPHETDRFLIIRDGDFEFALTLRRER